MNVPFSPKPQFPLTAWHKVQAAMLHHYASLDYLKELHKMVSQLLDGVVDPLLDLAKSQNRDVVLVDARWGDRNTSQNWANNAWPFLKAFQESLAKDIAGRAFERYKITGANQCLRGIQEYSMQWATPEEEDRFEKALQAIGRFAFQIDDTLDDYHNSRWGDFEFAYDYKEFAAQFPKIPEFRIRTDIQGESGKVPPRTGVYISQDDPHASLQFAWTGGSGGKLRPSNTFNEIGLDAIHTLGRRDLWFNEKRMFEFATSHKYAALFKDDVFFDGQPSPDLAPSAVSRKAFIDRPCKWYFVEMINGEFEDIKVVDDGDTADLSPRRHRIQGGQRCPQAGYWFTPAQVNSRHYFKQGDIMPVISSDYGATIWQWDSNQS